MAQALSALRAHAVELVCVAAAVAFAAAVLPSVPALRQDWSPYPFGVGAGELFTVATSGWSASGFGSPMPYPQAYLLAPVLALARLALGAEGTLVAFMLATGLLCAFGGRAIARSLRGSDLAASAAAVFLTFNPWTFTELVAGHSYMLLAYGASIWLLAETLRERPRPAVLILCLLGTVQQIQFLLIDTLVLAVVAWRARLVVPLLVAALVWLPSVIGIVASRDALLAIPFTTAWEANQSVAPLGALLLSGYFTGYGAQFSGTHSLPMVAVALLAAVAFSIAIRRRRAPAGIAVLTLLALVAAMGLRGPLGAIFGWSVAHFAPTAVFRELYDVLAFAVIGYAAFASSLRLRVAAWTFFAAAVALAALWWFPPPARWWIESSQLLPVATAAPVNTRFALIPAFQPLAFEGRGSGADPDAYARAQNVTPLNQYLPRYPAEAALGAFLGNGDTRALRALSVSEIVERPRLASRSRALAQQWAFPRDVLPPASHGNRRMMLAALPELSLIGMPAVGTLDRRLGSGNVFFADAARVRGALVPRSWSALGRVTPIEAENAYIHPDQGWVDARLAFAQRPSLAQGIGGVLTTNARAPLHLRAGVPALVWVDGTLHAQNGAVVARTTRGYRWVALRSDVDTVECTGTCVVAAQGSPPAAPLEPPSQAYEGVAFAAVTPWLVRASLPPGPAGALRYNVAYDDQWSAYLGGVRLTHLRLDTSANGWLLPARRRPLPLLVLQRAAAAQAGSELLTAIVLVALGARWLATAFVKPR
ncbi:MAG TPA: hypothetical protein VIN40_04550 [Candidatus Tyrphobacter sp.]